MILNSNYQNFPLYAYNKHLATIIPSVFRKIDGVEYTRKRITLSDGDFLDIDGVYNNNDKVVILSHGLEGSADKQYIKGAAKLFIENGWDVIAWNCRSCSGEMNLAPRLYHHGDIEDIGEVTDWTLSQNQYKQIGYIGFSMGGVINSKYLSTKGNTVDSSIVFNVAISAPCDLEACALALDERENILYKKKFYNSIKDKLIEKDKQHPGMLDVNRLNTIKYWYEFDESFSAKMNGFSDRKAFYKQATLLNFLEDIKVPTLVLNAQNDPIIPAISNPFTIARKSSFVHLEMPKYGGHCGYSVKGDYHNYAERRSLEFYNDIVN